jgi:hypothetical protein
MYLKVQTLNLQWHSCAIIFCFFGLSTRASTIGSQIDTCFFCNTGAGQPGIGPGGKIYFAPARLLGLVVQTFDGYDSKRLAQMHSEELNSEREVTIAVVLPTQLDTLR